MRCFDWKEEPSEIFGSVKRPIARIFLKDSEGAWQPTLAYVDSGADITVLKRSFGELLGIDIEGGKPAEFGGVSGGKIQAYIHKVELKIGNSEFIAEVVFCKDDRPPNLLGRRNIFNLFEIQFKNGNEQTCFIRSQLNK